MKHPYRIVHLDLCGSELSSFLCGRVLYYNTAVSAEYRRVVGVACVSESVCARERVRGKGPLCVICFVKVVVEIMCARERSASGDCMGCAAAGRYRLQPDLQPYLDLWSAASELRLTETEREGRSRCMHAWTWTEPWSDDGETVSGLPNAKALVGDCAETILW